MTPELKQLYQQTLLRHSKEPCNHHALDNAETVVLRNPLCGDEITLYRGHEHPHALSFTAQACSICLASASMMTESLANLSPEQAKEQAQAFVSKFADKEDPLELEGDLQALSGVLAFPSRVSCATLPWEAFLKLPD